MLSTAKWISPLAVGLLVSIASLSPALSFAAPDEPTPARQIRFSGATDDDDLDAARASEDIRQDELDDADGAAVDEEVEVITERYPNGAVKIEREVAQDENGNYINDGLWEMWDPQGSPIAQGEYSNNQRTGTWVRWYRNAAEAPLLARFPYQQFGSSFVSQAVFKQGQLDGPWTIYDGKKHKISQWEFVGGKRHGASIWWHANGHKLREIQFRDGEIDGELAEWSAEGKVLVRDTYQFGRRLARKTANHPNGKKKTEGMYLAAKEVEKTPDDWWSCKPQVTVPQGTDEKHGAWTTWYPNGQLQQEGIFEHDLQEGKFTWWHDNGQKALEGKFIAGKQHGPWTWWYDIGQKSIRGEYSSGTPTGRWTWWKEDGKVAQSADLSLSDGVAIETPDPTNLETPPQAVQSLKRNPKR
jgi:uncharacterized protein